MTDRSVRVVLSAITAQYQAAMAKAKSTMVGFGASATNAGTRMTSVGKSFDKAGSAMMRTGSTLTRRVSFPLLAVGAASVKAALDYDRAFTRISANTNLTTKQIEALKKQVLSLADETAEAPQDLAEGLYFLASAGLSAQQVTETLEMSAKAAASGFGSVGQIARLTANALNAYEKDGLTAADVTDTLAAAIREGTAEPEEFASALGRILPIAQKAGVSFDEVTASLASLSNIGLDVNEGVTAMRGVIQAIEAPGKQAQDTLDEIGLSADELRAALADQGVLAALDLLEDKTNGNIDTLHKIIPNVRALSGLFGITGQNADKVAGSFQRVKNSTGDLDAAFKTTQKSDAWKWKHFITQMKTVAIRIGTDIMPVVMELTEIIGDLVKDFMDLSPAMRQNILKWGALAIAVGPVVTLFGGLLRTLGGIGRASGYVLGSLGKIGSKTPAPGTGVPPVVPGGGGIAGFAKAHPILSGAVVTAALLWAEKQRRANNVDEELDANEKLLDVASRWGATNERTAKTIAALGDQTGIMAGSQVSLNDAFDKANRGLFVTEEGYALYKRTLGAAVGITDKQRIKLRTLTDAVSILGVGLTETEAQWVENLLAVGDFSGAIDILNGVIDESTGKTKPLGKGFTDAGADADQAAIKVNALNAALANLPSTKTISIRTLFSEHSSSGGADALVGQNPKAQDSGGGGGSGTPSKPPLDPTFLGYMTPSSSRIVGGSSTVINIHAPGSTMTESQWRNLMNDVIDRANRTDGRLAKARR